MKNKILKFIGVILITTFILSYLSSTALVSAAEETPGLVLETSDTKNIGLGILQTERPVASTLQFNSNVSGGFNYLDFKGVPQVTEDSVLETEDSELYYPVNLRYENFWNQEYLKEFTTCYARAQNVSDQPDQYGEYPISLLTEQYSLSVDDSCEIFVSDLTSEVLFDVKSKGIYQIWFNDITPISLDIISPSNKIITPQFGVLPEAVSGGLIPLGQYIYFAAYETGTYRIYIETPDPIIKLRADYHKPQPIKFGEAINEGKDPSDPTFFDTVYTMNVYELDINDLETVNKYLLDFEFGSTGYSYYFIEDSLEIYWKTLSDGINEVLPSITTGKIYLVIDNPEYFFWGAPGIDVANPQKYTLKFEQIEPSEHVIGDNETINLAKSIGVTARTFEIVNTSLVSFHFEDVGANSPDVFGNAVLKIDEDETRYASIPSTISTTNGTFYSALLEPGKYEVIFQHSGSMGPEYLHFYSKVVEFETLNVENMDLSGFSAYNFTTLDFEDVTLPTWENYPNTYGATYPIGFNFSIDENFWDYGYNISIHTDKNPDLFDDYITPDLASLFDASPPQGFTDYTDAIQPGNTSKVPVKTDGSSDGDALIIGSYDKFDQAVITLADPSNMDAFVWEYYDDSYNAWTRIDSEDSNFADGTWSSIGSLNRSGTISWDPEELNDWDIINRGTDSTALELPDTNNQNYYLIRVVCNDSSASIANITSVSLRKFVRINIDIECKLAFNIGTTEKPVYYTASSGSSPNLKFQSSYGQANYFETIHDFDKNYFLDEAILYLYAKDMQQYDYNGSKDGNSPYAPFEKPLTFSICVFQPDNYKQIIDYNISTNNATTHSNQLNLTTLTSDMSETIDIPDLLTLYLNITPRTLYDWTQINVQFVNASVVSTKLILPAKYDLNTAWDYLNTYFNGQFNLGLTGIDMNASIEFGFITETAYLEFVIMNTTNNPAIFKVFGSQFNYSMLTILDTSSETNWILYGGIGGGVVVLIAVSVIIYKKKHPV